MQETATQISENKQAYLDKQDRLEKLSALNSKIDQAEETMNLMSEALPTEEQRASSVSILDSLASRAGVNLVSFVKSSTESSGFGEQATDQPQLESEQIDIALSGEYPGVSKFVGSLSNSRRPFSLNSIQLNEGGANINLTGYYLATE
jgi:Tfp pilus assembly protein PilO